MPLRRRIPADDFPRRAHRANEQVINAVENNPAFIMAAICLPAPLIIIGFFCAYQGVVNAMRALAGKPVHYALSIPFVK